MNTHCTNRCFQNPYPDSRRCLVGLGSCWCRSCCSVSMCRLSRCRSRSRCSRSRRSRWSCRLKLRRGSSLRGWWRSRSLMVCCCRYCWTGCLPMSQCYYKSRLLIRWGCRWCQWRWRCCLRWWLRVCRSRCWSRPSN